MDENHEKLLKHRCRYRNCILDENEYPVSKENIPRAGKRTF